MYYIATPGGPVDRETFVKLSPYPHIFNSPCHTCANAHWFGEYGEGMRCVVYNFSTDDASTCPSMPVDCAGYEKC